MIVTIWLYAFYYFLSAAIFILPPMSWVPGQIDNGINYILGVLGYFDAIIPVQSLLSALLILMGFEFAIFTYRLINWGINKLRGSG